jgi:peptide-methionine (S)-S-oxide reductase
MNSYILQIFLIGLCSLLSACSSVQSSALATVEPAVQSAPEPVKGEQTAVFAGGCFWGVEGVFEHVKGVVDARSGYAGGTKKTADYETVSSGKTGHAESVEVRFNPSVVSYRQLLEIFFSVAHDPTQLNYQGPDHGTQYRSAIFYVNDEQRQAATAFVEELTKAGSYSAPIVTQIVPLEAFYPAESYHQNYMKLNPSDGYIVHNDAPKVAALKDKFPDLYVEK